MVLVHLHVASTPINGSSFRLDRRAHPRIPGDRLSWLRRAQLKAGPAVSVLDFSAGGVRFDAMYRLQPGSTAALEIVTDERQATLPLRILRSEVASLERGVLYRGACAFTQPVAWAATLVPQEEKQVAASSEWPRQWSEVIVRLIRGKLVKGYTYAFHPSRSDLDVFPSPNAPERLKQTIALPQVRTILFVRELTEQGLTVPPTPTSPRASDRKVEVTFSDGDTIVGTTPALHDTPHGFLLHPATGGEHDLRMFVVASAVAHVRVL
jgi:hypothetical protein